MISDGLPPKILGSIFASVLLDLHIEKNADSQRFTTQ